MSTPDQRGGCRRRQVGGFVRLRDDYHAASDRGRLQAGVGQFGQVAGHRLVRGGHGGAAALAELQKVAPASRVGIDRCPRLGTTGVVVGAFGAIGQRGERREKGRPGTKGAVSAILSAVSGTLSAVRQALSLVLSSRRAKNLRCRCHNTGQASTNIQRPRRARSRTLALTDSRRGDYVLAGLTIISGN